MEKKTELLNVLDEMYHDARVLIVTLTNKAKLNSFISLLDSVQDSEYGENELTELRSHIDELMKEGYWHMIDYIRIDLYRLVG